MSDQIKEILKDTTLMAAMSGDCVKCREYKKRIAELEARLDAVRNCKRYLCEFPDIGKIGGAYRARDIDAALEQDDD